MKVKHFVEATGESLDDMINDFIEDKLVLDIKYSGNVSYTADGGIAAAESNYSALVMYKDIPGLKQALKELKEKQTDEVSN